MNARERWELSARLAEAESLIGKALSIIQELKKEMESIPASEDRTSLTVREVAEDVGVKDLLNLEESSAFLKTLWQEHPKRVVKLSAKTLERQIAGGALKPVVVDGERRIRRADLFAMFGLDPKQPHT